MNRISNIAAHLKLQSIASADDVVICCALRTPITKAKRGLLKDTPPEVLLSAVLKGITQKTGLDPKLVQDIAVGNCLQPGSGEITARMAMFLAGYPDTTTIVSINRFCSSGLQSCATIASKIKAGFIEIGIGAGVQSMSLFNAGFDKQKVSKQALNNAEALKVLLSMGETSQNVATKFGITREQQDLLAYQSQQKAAKAQRQGLYSEITPVSTKVKDDKGAQKEVTVTQDDGIRQTTLQMLAKLKPSFSKTGSSTPGNSSQVSDGAAAVLFARRETAQKLKLPILATFKGYATKGCPPEIMGIGPAVVIPQLLKKTGNSVQDIDIWEINQAFASQAAYCVEKLGIDRKKLNPKGGAIALGHPLACTGARQIATLIPELKRTKGKKGVVSMCVGSGMGAAGLIESE